MPLDTQDHQHILDYPLAPTSTLPTCTKGRYDDSQHDHGILSLLVCIQCLEINGDETTGHQDLSEDSLICGPGCIMMYQKLYHLDAEKFFFCMK
jgi:hypothetical protein